MYIYARTVQRGGAMQGPNLPHKFRVHPRTRVESKESNQSVGLNIQIPLLLIIINVHINQLLTICEKKKRMQNF